MQEWLISQFPAIGNNGEVSIFSSEWGATAYNPINASADFAAIVSLPPSHSALSLLPLASQGWQKIFDDWKAKGKIV